MKRRIFGAFGMAAVLAMGAGVPEAFAVASSQVFRTFADLTVTSTTAVGFGDSVSAGLGASPKAVVVTWSTDYVGDDLVVGLKVNGGSCGGYGPGRFMAFAGPGFHHGTLQWVILPAELSPGLNTFEVCGHTEATGTLLGYRTLAVRKSN